MQFPVSDLANTAVLTNPSKFSVYRNGAWSLTTGQTGKVEFDTKTLDTGGDFDAVTNFRFTARVPGSHFFTSGVQFTALASSQYVIFLTVNTVEAKRGNQITFSGPNLIGLQVSGLLDLAANDYVEVFFFNGGNSTQSGSVGPSFTYFDGFLLSGN